MTRKKNSFDLQKEYLAPGTQTRIADIDNRFCREVEKSVCADKVYPNTLHLDNTRPNENINAIVIATIWGERATHCNCSQKCHTCKQQKIDSCRDV